MGRRGPPPTPTHLKLLAGNPGKRPINKREPVARPGAPRCPEWMPPEGRREWHWMVRELRGMKLLSVVDRHALMTYCQTWVRWRAAEEFIAKHGESYPIRDDTGRVRCMQQFPQVATARNHLLILKAYQQEFGMTPSARSRIQIGNNDDDMHDARWFPPELCDREPEVSA